KKEFRLLYEKATFKGLDGDLLLKYFLLLENSVFNDSWQNDKVKAALLQYSFFEELEQHPAFFSAVKNEISNATAFLELLDQVREKGILTKRFLPKVLFYANNQYHVWLFGSNNKIGAIQGNFGKSITNGKPVLKRIKESLPWTFVLSLVSIILSLLTSILLGLVLGYFSNKKWAQSTNSILFLLYTLPQFWVATLLLIFFANPDYLSWFPPGGVVKSYELDNPSFANVLANSAWYLVLPVVASVYSSIAVLTRYVQSSTVESLKSIYVFAARARGLSEIKITFKHILPNVLLPLITLMGAAIPGLFSGAIIIETVYSIPGMGMELLNAIYSNDINLVVGILTIASILTIIGYLVSDILYTLIDPRIKLDKI
ncbi:MAG: ABC transporter permease, partial [Bacteroidia bacterium]